MHYITSKVQLSVTYSSYSSQTWRHRDNTEFSINVNYTIVSFLWWKYKKISLPYIYHVDEEILLPIKLIHCFFLKNSGEESCSQIKSFSLITLPVITVFCFVFVCLPPSPPNFFWVQIFLFPFLFSLVSNSLTWWLLTVSWALLFPWNFLSKMPKCSEQLLRNLITALYICIITLELWLRVFHYCFITQGQTNQLQNQMKRSFSFIFKSPCMRQRYLWSQTIWQQMHWITLSRILINNCLEFVILYIFRINCCKTGSWDENRSLNRSPLGRVCAAF